MRGSSSIPESVSPSSSPPPLTADQVHLAHCTGDSQDIFNLLLVIRQESTGTPCGRIQTNESVSPCFFFSLTDVFFPEWRAMLHVVLKPCFMFTSQKPHCFLPLTRLLLLSSLVASSISVQLSNEEFAVSFPSQNTTAKISWLPDNSPVHPSFSGSDY